jgi:hypothetical protein
LLASNVLPVTVAPEHRRAVAVHGRERVDVGGPSAVEGGVVGEGVVAQRHVPDAGGAPAEQDDERGVLDGDGAAALGHVGREVVVRDRHGAVAEDVDRPAVAVVGIAVGERDVLDQRLADVVAAEDLDVGLEVAVREVTVQRRAGTPALQGDRRVVGQVEVPVAHLALVERDDVAAAGAAQRPVEPVAGDGLGGGGGDEECGDPCRGGYESSP